MREMTTHQASNMSAELPAKYISLGEWAVGWQRTLLQVFHSKTQLVFRKKWHSEGLPLSQSWQKQNF